MGNEFSSVEALWSQFENVMARDPDVEVEEKTQEDREERREDDSELSEENYPRR